MSTTLGYDNRQLFIEEGSLSIGKVTSPERVGFDTIDLMERWEPIGFLGYHKQGTINLQVPRTFAEAISGTPGVRIARRMVMKQTTLAFNLFQINADLWKYCWALKTKRNHITTSNGTEVHNYAWLGPNEPPQCYYAILLDTKLENGHPFRIMLWYAQNNSEALALTYPGTNYGDYPVIFTAFPHPNFASIAGGDQMAFGIIDEQVDNSEDIC